MNRTVLLAVTAAACAAPLGAQENEADASQDLAKQLANPIASSSSIGPVPQVIKQSLLL